VFSSRKAPGEWESLDIATPHTEGSGPLPLGELSEYKLFSSDLTLGLVQPVDATPLPPLPAGSERTDYLRSANGEYTALVTATNVSQGTKFGGELTFEGASADLNQVVLRSRVALTPTSTGGGLYEWSAGQLQPVSILPGPEHEQTEGDLGDRDAVVRHAVSDDGSRVVWGTSTREFLRDTTRKETVRVDTPEEGLVEGNDETHFQTASSTALLGCW
jgi:hypothetical protein